MSHVRKWSIPISLVIGVMIGVVIGINVTNDLVSSANEQWNMKYRQHVQDISYLMDQYTHHKMETGNWPDAKQLYGSFFSLRDSVAIENGREDLFSDSSFGQVWLQFTLKDDGHIHAAVMKNVPAGI